MFSGPEVGIDPNFGFFFDTLNPSVTLGFLAVGKHLQRSYEARISTVGLKFDFSLRLQLGFLWRPPFKKLYYKEPIPLGRGFDLIITVNNIL
jgi:hypothetical protein